MRAVQIVASLSLVAALHLAILQDRPAVFFISLLLFGAFLVLGQGSSRAGIFCVVVASAALAALQLGVWQVFNLVYLPPIAVNALLLFTFGGSLLPGREPLIARFRRLQVGWDTPEIVRYTRRLTLLWTLFFVVSLLLSLVLPVAAGPVVWSWVVNLACPLLALAFFVGEHAYRAVILPHFGPASLAATLGTLMRPQSWRGTWHELTAKN